MGYSYSGLGTTEYTEFQFRKERSWIWKRNTHGGGDLKTTSKRPHRISRQIFPKRTRILSIPSKPYSFHSVHSAIRSRMNGMIFRSFRKRNSSQKNTNTVYSEYSYSGIVPKERAQDYKYAVLLLPSSFNDKGYIRKGLGNQTQTPPVT